MAAPKKKASSPAQTGKGKGTPGGGARSPKPAPENPPEPSVEVPMRWVAVGGRIGGQWFVEDLSISWPDPVAILAEYGQPGDNIAIAPRPADLVVGISAEHPYYSQPVKGRLPHLKLYPAYTGNNKELWSEYLVAHPPRTAQISDADFRNRELTLPKD